MTEQARVSSSHEPAPLEETRGGFAHEPLAVAASYCVVHTGQVGRLVDVLEMEELFGGWAEWFRARLRLRPRRRWQATWVVLRFDDESEGAFRLSELEKWDGG